MRVDFDAFLPLLNLKHLFFVLICFVRARKRFISANILIFFLTGVFLFLFTPVLLLQCFLVNTQSPV